MIRPPISPPDLIAEELRACAAANSAGEFAAAVVMAERIRADATAAGRHLDAARAVPVLADSLLRLGDMTRVIATARACLPELDALPLPEDGIRLRTTLARALTQVGEPVAALLPATEALALAR